MSDLVRLDPTVLLLPLLLLIVTCAPPPDPSRYPLIPAPRTLEPRSGVFRVGPATRIVLPDTADPELRRLAEHLAGPLRAAGVPLPLTEEPGANAIVLRLSDAEVADSPEAYRLDVTERGIALEASTEEGLFRGLQTIRQLLPPLAGRGAVDAAGEPERAGGASSVWEVPAVRIEDAPRFSYRGMHLDVGRHMFPVDFIKKYIDLLALYKLNTFHWHLTEDQGWRIEIRAYPRLTEVGSRRAETQVEHYNDPYLGDSTAYGGYYTQEEVREIVAYAAARHITVIPEIELPGHSSAALAAYPELACGPGPYDVGTRWGIYEDIYCPKEETFAFLENVLLEVMELFPSEYIHIGGDEAPKAVWRESPVAQEVMEREGLADEDELQSWFVRRIERFLNAHGRKLIGWDEILEGGLPPEATVMSWRGMEGGIEAARAGHDVIMTPTSDLYFDYYQADPEIEPMAIGGFTPLEQVYAFEPVPPELDGEAARHVLGAQANVWTEYIPEPDRVEYMAVPRMLALAEVVWSPEVARDWDSFTARLTPQLRRLAALDVNFRLPHPRGLADDGVVEDDSVRVSLDAPLPGLEVRYTTDGTTPTPSATLYTEPFTIAVPRGGVTVAARAFLPAGRGSPVVRATYTPAVPRAAVDVPSDELDGGLAFTSLEGPIFSLVEAAEAATVRSGVIDSVSVPEPVRSSGMAPDSAARLFGVRLRGFLQVPEDGVYTFHMTASHAGRLTIAGRTLLEDDAPPRGRERAREIALARGWHPLEILYVHAVGQPRLELEVRPPDGERRPVPPDWLAHRSGASAR